MKMILPTKRFAGLFHFSQCFDEITVALATKLINKIFVNPSPGLPPFFSKKDTVVARGRQD